MATLTVNDTIKPDTTDTLVMQHMESVRQILARVVAELPPHVDRENIRSAGTLGLVEAACKYDSTRGVSFKTFAYCRIRGAMIDELRRNCPLPQRVLENLSKVRSVTRHETRGLDVDEVVQESGLSESEVTECITASRLTATREFSEFDETDVSSQRTHTRPESAVEVEEVHSQLTTALTQLPERQRLTISLYYCDGLKLREIADVLGLSESRTSRLLSRARSCLRDIMRSRGIAGLSDLPAELV